MAEVHSLLSTKIRKYVYDLLKEGRVGICAGTLRVVDVGSSSPTASTEPCGDRFKVVIPFGGQSLAWEVLFNEDAQEPPDFIFGVEDTDFAPEIGTIKGLVQWKHEDPKSLTFVMRQLLEEYRIYQQNIINKNSRLHFEYSSLLEHVNIQEHDIELHAFKKNGTRLGPVNFLIKLPVDFTNIPAYMTKNNPGDDTAVLLVTFHSAEGSKVTPQLYLSPRVEHSLGGAATLRIPAYPNGGCLMDYVPHVCELLKNKIDQIIHGYQKRKEYISAFLSHFGRCTVEYDAEGFTKICFLKEWHDFFFLVTVDLPAAFPITVPVFTFQSIYHDSNGGIPFNRMVKDYPYSPRWSANEMAERAKSFILEYISVFQKESIKGGNFRQRFQQNPGEKANFL